MNIHLRAVGGIAILAVACVAAFPSSAAAQWHRPGGQSTTGQGGNSPPATGGHTAGGSQTPPNTAAPREGAAPQRSEPQDRGGARPEGTTASTDPPTRRAVPRTTPRQVPERATVVTSGGYYGGYYPWGWSGLGFGYYGGPFDDPWFYGGGYQAPYGYSNALEGSLRLKVKPRAAEVTVDGYYAGRVDDFDGMFQQLHVESGPHTIQIRADGYEPLTFDVRIRPDRKTTYTGELRKIP